MNMKEQQTEYFELQELRVKRGEKQNGRLHVDGTPYVLHATVLCGERPGKTLLLTAGVHSCEYVGIQTLMEMAGKLEPAQIIGNVIIIPVVNRTGFETRRPTVVPEDEKNLNRGFSWESGRDGVSETCLVHGTGTVFEGRLLCRSPFRRDI